jgi:hypothetical protein
MGILDKKHEMSAEPSPIKLSSCSTSLDLLQAVYRDETLPLYTRLRAAAMALPFEHPKLAVTALVPDDGRFAEQLGKAIERSQAVRVITIDPEPPPQAGTDVTLRPQAPDRRYRR